MPRTYEYIRFERTGDVYCVSFQQPNIEDEEMQELAAELGRLIDEENCRKMVLNLGPEAPECLYSLFLAKLINLHRRLEASGGSLALAHVSDHVRGVFRAAGIEKFFHFYSDQQSAQQALSAHG